VNICILIPTTGEARGLIRALKMKKTGPSSYLYEAPGVRAALHICGMGMDNARERTESLFNREIIEYLVLAGVCGGLQKNASLGDLVIDTQHPDPDFTQTIQRTAERRGITVHQGKIHTSSHVVAAPEEKRALGVQFGAVAVDMEGKAVLDLCAAHNLPFRSFRTVSDDVSQRLPKALGRIALSGKLTWRFWRAIILLAWEWPSVCRMLLSARKAKRNLSAVLLDWLHGLKTDGNMSQHPVSGLR